MGVIYGVSFLTSLCYSLKECNDSASRLPKVFGKLTQYDKAIGMIGMPRIQAYITRQKFHLFRPFCMLPAGHTVKKIFSLRLVQHILQPTSVDRGFMPDLLSLACRYNLTDLVWMDSMKGNTPDKTVWDELITYHLNMRNMLRAVLILMIFLFITKFRTIVVSGLHCFGRQQK